MKTTRSKQLLLTLLSLALPLLAPAVNLTWDANTAVTGAQDGSGTWHTNTANWWNGSADVLFNNATPDAAFFGNANGTAGTVTLATNVTPFGITFNAASVGNYTLAGGGFTLGLTNRTVAANVNATISAPIGGTIVTLANSAAQVPIGTLTLSGANAYTGGLVLGVNAPNTTTSARLAHNTAAGTGTISFNGNGNSTSPRVELTGGITVANPLSIAGRNVFAHTVESFSGANTLSGAITPGAGGVAYSFGVDGSSSLTLSGTLTIQANGGRNVILRGSGNGTISGVIAGGTATSLTNVMAKTGSGTWTFSGANTFLGVATEVAGGTLALDYAAQNNSKLTDVGVLYLVGGTLGLTGGSHTEVVGSSTVGAGMNAVTRSSGTSTLRMNALTRLGGGTVDFGAASIADTDALNVNGILGGYATLAGADWAINSTGAGDGAVTAYSSYTDIAATGSTIADGTATNVRLNSAGGGGNMALGAATTSVNTLLQNTTTAATIDTAAKILRLGAIGGVLVPSGKQNLVIGTAANSGTLTAGGADNTAGEIVLINNSANALTVNSVIADNGSGVVSLTKSGTGSATLAGNNTHTGTNFVSGGSLNISSAANLGTGPVVINGGTLSVTASTDLGGRVVSVGGQVGYGSGTIDVASGQTLTNNGVVQNNVSGANPSLGAANAGLLGMGTAGSLTKTGNGTLILGGANTYGYGTIINGGTISISSDGNLGQAFGCYIPEALVLNGGTLQASGTFTLSANRGVRLGPVNGSGTGTIGVDASQTLTFSGQLSDNWAGTGSFAKSGDGTLILGGGVNDYSGNTTVSGGVLQINNSRALPNGAGKGNLVNNGTVNINGVNVALNGLTGSGTVDNITATAMTLSVGNNDQGGTFSGALNNTGSGALALSKTGTGTLTLSGASGYTGSTIINNGILALTGSASLSGTTNIAVGSGTTFNVSGLTGGTLTLASGQTLSGTGTVLGTIDTTGGGAVAPGASAGTLSVQNLTLGGGSLNYELANVTTTGGGVNDYTVVSGHLHVSDATTLNLTYLNALPAASGKYTLISYGSFSGNVNNISVPSGFTINNNTTDKTIELLINHVPASLTWVGDGVANVWDINSTPNWTGGATFFNGDTANFGSSGSATPAINVTVPVIAAAVTVTGPQNYSFTGSSVGSASLTKSGAGTLTLENDHTYNTSVLISSGTVQVGNAGTTGTLGGTATITNNAALVLNRSDSLVVSNAITGSGTLAQIGAGSSALTASNSYTGVTTVSAGTLQVANGSALGSTAAGTTVASGAQLYITLNVNVDNESLTLGGSGVAADGALRKGGAGTSIYGGGLTLTENTMLKLDGNSVLNLTNTAGINGAAVNAGLLLAGDGGSSGNITGPIALGTGGLTNNGGTWTVSAANNYAGNTVINGGALRISSPLSLGVTPGVWTPDRVTLNGGTLEVSNNVSVALNDGKVGITLTASSVLGVDAGATLTITNEISGTGAIQKWFPGLLVLGGSNSYTGSFFTDGNSTSANDGTTRITRSDALANVTDIGMRNNNGGFSTLQLDGSAGSVALSQPLTISCRNNTNLCLQNLAGSNVLSGGVSIQVGGADQWWQSDSGILVFAADINYAGTLTGGRNYHFQGAGDFLVTGNINISPINSPISLSKDGPGKLTLTGVNTYGTTTGITNGVLLLTGSISHTGAVTVAGGTLAGTGTITAEAVNVQAGGTLAPGASIGTLTINGNLSLAGTTRMELNKTAGTKDFVTGINTASYGGTLVVTNLAGTLNIGDTFQLFSAAFTGGNFASIVNQTGQGNIAFTFNPSSGVLTVVAGIPTTPTNISYSVSGNTLTLSWPANYLGVILQAQTNSLSVGLNTNWTDIPGTAAVTSTNLTINPADPTVFFRLRHP